MYLPGWDPSEEAYAHTTIDLSHAAIAQSDVVDMAVRMGSGSATSTSPTAAARPRTSTSCPAAA